MYEFSAPMPYEIENIDKLLDINNHVEKSRITSLFFSLPSVCELFTGFEQHRNGVNKPFDYWKSLIEYALNKTDFIYLLNNPVRMQIENPDFEKQLEKLDLLLIELQKLGVKNLRIAEHKLMSYIEKHYPYFNIYASTSFEFKSLSEYKNFMFMHPSVKQVVPSSDCIKNFTFLKNLKTLLPDVEIELMVNEGCVNGCPNRYWHASEVIDRIIVHGNDITISTGYFTNVFCHEIENINSIMNMTKSNVIYPWEVEEYGKIGIKKFKLVGRDAYIYRIQNYLNEYLLYLKGIDDIRNIENEPINTFIHHLSKNNILKQLKVKEVKNLLPNIKHFKKYGELCSSACGAECGYCGKCAEKIEKVFKKKQEEMKKRTIPICVITK